MKRMSPRLTLPTAAHAAPWVTGLLVVAVAATLAQITWLALPAAPDAAPASAAPVAAPRPQAAPDGLTQAAALHLFGTADTTPELAAVDAPDTRLNLTLRGIFADPQGQYSYALIVGPDLEERHYREGAAVAGDVRIRSILADRVILERNGRLETLRLPQDRLETAAPDTAAASAAPLGQRLSSLRRDLLGQPQNLGKLVGIQPVSSDGRLHGYRLQPRQEAELFRQAGLQAGDVVTEINGIPVNDTARLGTLMQQLANAGTLQLTVERGGRPLAVTLSFSN